MRRWKAKTMMMTGMVTTTDAAMMAVIGDWNCDAPVKNDSAAGTVRGFLRSQANTIEGGTSNIMRNILGERVLGLPKEPDLSRELPWRDVPRSA